MVLDHFAGQNPAGMVWTYDKRGEVAPRPSRPEETAVESNLHTIFDAEGQPNDMIETWLSKVESNAAQAYERLVEGALPSDEDRADVAMFLGSLYTRSPGMRRFAGNLIGAMAQSVADLLTADKERYRRQYERFQRETGDETKVDIDSMYEFMKDKSNYHIEVNKQATIMSLHVTEEIAEVFFHMSWTTMTTSLERPFITGDVPLTSSSNPATHHPFYGDGGLMNRTVEVSMPLSPTRLLLMTWLPEDRPEAIVCPRENVFLANRFRAYSAERFLYADRRDAGVRRLAEKFPQPQPGLRVSGVDMSRIKIQRRPRSRRHQPT